MNQKKRKKEDNKQNCKRAPQIGIKAKTLSLQKYIGDKTKTPDLQNRPCTIR